MKKIVLIGSFLGLFAVEIAWAQVGVGTTLPDESAQLDVVSNNKGVLLPRVSLTGTGDSATITNPATSLMVYNTNTVSDVTSGFYFWNGTVWERLKSGDSSPAQSVEPTIAAAGETYYNINENKFYVSDGTEWNSIDSDRLAYGKMLLGDATGKKVEVTMSGDITMDNTGAVTIANGVVTTAKMATSGAADADRVLTTDSGGNPQWEDKEDFVPSSLMSLTEGQVYVGNGTNVASSVALTGDIVMNNTGAVTIANGVVTTAKMGTSGVADADMVLTTDSGGNPQWEEKEDLVSSSSLMAGQVYVGNSSNIATAMTLGGAFTMDDRGISAINQDMVESAMIRNGTITNLDVNANAAIAGSKISPNFGNQRVLTTGNIEIIDQNFALVTHINVDGGDLTVVDDVEIGGDLWVNGSFNSPSDKRLKKNIKTITSVLAKINQLRGVYYRYKDQQKYAAGPQIGLIAQELQKVFPELVKKGADGYLAVNYSQLTAVVIQAVKEQQKEINLLKTRMQRIEKELGF